MKRPAVGLAIVFAAGIWLGAQVNWPPAWLAGGTVLLLLAWRVRPVALTIFLAVACAGMLSYRQAIANSAPDHISNLLERRDQNAALRGVIVSAPDFRNDRCSFKLELAALNRGADWERATGRVFVFSHQPAGLRYGDEIECAAVLRVPASARNPGTFDLRQWLTQQNIPFTATILKSDRSAVLASNRGRPVTALALRLRERMETALRLGLENEPAIAGALAAVVIGERAEIPPDTYADFQQTGVFHVFAINGLHVGLVTMVVVLLLRLLRVPRRWTAILAIPLLVLYVFATGAHPGAVRSLVMVCVWLLGGMLVRPVDLLSSLAMAAIVILVWSPVSLFDGGFVLSFAVVTALATLTDRTAWWKFFLNPDPTEAEPAWLVWLRPDPLVPRELVPVWRMKLVRAVMWLAMLAGGSTVAWLGLVPLMAVYFHLFTPVSIVANLLVIPLLGSVIALGLASVVAHAVWPGLALVFNNANFFVLGVMLRGVNWLSRWPWGHWFVQAPPVWLTVSYYAVLLVWMSRQLSRRVKLLITGGAMLVATVALVVQHETVVEITVLDLRDGMAVFVNPPGEQHDFLVDGGGPWSGERVVVPFLRGQGVDRLEALVLTRNNKAHAAGLTAVVQAIPVRRVLHNGTYTLSKYFGDWLATARRQHLEVGTVRADDVWRVAGDFRWRVLHPPVPFSGGRRSDDNSVVLLLEYGPTRVLLTSDIGQSVEHFLVAGKADLRAQILVKGRHGTEPTGADEFLDAVQPAAVVQVVNSDQSNRYLEPALRDRLRQRQIPLYRTDETGAVTIRLHRTGYEILTCAGGGKSD